MGYTDLKAIIDANIKTNGRQQITGSVLNGVMTNVLQGVDVLDRANPADTSGMNEVVLKKTRTFSEQVTAQNTIYEIRDSFDLSNGSVTIPTGSVLKFNGGIVKNGSIVGQATSLNAPPVKIFDNVTISGTWNVDSAFVEWFGAAGNGSTDDIVPFRKAISAFKKIQLLPKSYSVSAVVEMSGNQVISGVANKTKLICAADGIRVGHSCIVKGLSIKVTGDYKAIKIDSEHLSATYDSGDGTYSHTANILVEDLVITTDNATANGYGVHISANGQGTSFWQVRVSDIKVIGYFTSAIKLETTNSGWITDVVFEQVKVSGCALGVHVLNSTSSGANIGRITFNGLSMQFNKNRTLYFAKVEKSQRVSFNDCEPFDFPNANPPFYVTASCSGIAINDCVNGSGNPVELDGYVSTVNADNYPYKIVKSSREANQPVFNGGVYFGDRIGQGTIKYGELFSLPSGIFYFSSAYSTGLATFLNVPDIPGLTFAYATLLIIKRFEQGIFAQIVPDYHGSFFSGVLSRFIVGVSSPDDTISNAWAVSQPYLKNYDSEADFLAGEGYSALGLIKGKVVRRAGSSKATDASGRKYFANYGSSVPSMTGVAYADTGQQFFYTTQRRPIFLVQSAGIWVDALGRPYNRKLSGATTDRPTDAQLAVGDTYFDTTLGKPIWYNGTGWVDATGASV